MGFRRWIQLMTLIGVLGAAGYLAADDDDEDEHEHRRTEQPLEKERGRARARTRFRQLEPVASTRWKEECAACHTLYHPGLLPTRSWIAMMDDLENHFGENASLDPAARAEITAFLVDHAADRAPSLRSRRIAQSIPAVETPLRFTQTRYFERRHEDVSSRVFARPSIGSAANCAACHRNADAGIFDEEQVRIPRP